MLSISIVNDSYEHVLKRSEQSQLGQTYRTSLTQPRITVNYISQNSFKNCFFLGPLCFPYTRHGIAYDCQSWGRRHVRSSCPVRRFNVCIIVKVDMANIAKKVSWSGRGEDRGERTPLLNGAEDGKYNRKVPDRPCRLHKRHVLNSHSIWNVLASTYMNYLLS